ncbi:Hpt domain-containing protein [uncultured Roseobacter sp.]|uniref:Hpt domain-containing protein n=1 Tax=uncultured Roseobacter sp. TaxID=114847 RepID=UPI00261CE71B|nr:Hpt domain-containing protein [uncultured Roseobacter sp.]
MIDWDRIDILRDEVGAEDFDEVVELFLDEVDEAVGDLDTTADPVALSEKLHFLKGSALSLGFRSFSEMCQSGEAAAARKNTAAIDLVALRDCYGQSRHSFLAELPGKYPG